MPEDIIMLDEELSKTLKSIIKNGKYDLFIECMEENNIQANSFFYAKRDKYCLLYAALCNNFSNRNYKGRIQIIQYLVDNGADLNDKNPYDYPLVCGFINQIYYLKNTNAKIEVNMELIKLGINLVRRNELDVNQIGANEERILDQALVLYSLYLARPEWSFDGVLTLLSKRLVEELLNKGAQYNSDDDEYNEIVSNMTTSYTCP
ncbi:hypothetical protein [Spirochaeta cellobiosiphila]|uniref:hypothetical protein n=1 Tax=Spirochaeta cellobiosiphila TaxID=504483 RepID=UPI00041D7760|nr:hypothetical protein [Spirochaeta cellobiosiphila]